MQINGKPTPAEISEVNRMVRSGLTWTRLLARQAYALFIAAIILWALIRAFASGRAINWQSAGPMIVSLVVVVAYIWIRTLRITGRSKTAANQVFPDTISLDTGGVKAESSSGANSFTPWSSFKGWRMGKQVAFLQYAGKQSVLILPTANLSMLERESLRGTLQSYLGPSGKQR